MTSQLLHQRIMGAVACRVLMACMLLCVLSFASAARSSLSPPPPGIEPAAGRGIFVQEAEAERSQFIPWVDETTFQKGLARLGAAGGGMIRFAPGEYPIRVGLFIERTHHVRICGSPGTVLHFAPEPEARPSLAKPVSAGDRTIMVDDASTMAAGRPYQVYAANLTGDRILEFRAKRIEGNLVHLSRPVRFLAHVKEIPAGSTVVEEINIFKVLESADVTIENLVIEGRGRGDVLGHTTYCGIWAIGVHKSGVRPTTYGLTIRGCKITGFDGRGICAYSLGGVVVEGCQIESIGAQAIEIDHFACGRLEGNHLRGARVGIALNDAFDTVVANNSIEDCTIGVAFVKHYDLAEFNCGLVVEDNLIFGKVRWGVDVRPGITGNIIRGNLFGDIAKDSWVTGEKSNTIEGSGPLR